MKIYRKTAALALALLLCCTADVYAKDICLKVGTVDTFESKSRNFEARIVTPAVSGLAVDKERDKLNAFFAERADTLKTRFAERRAAVFGENQKSDERFSVVMDYAVRTDNDNLYILDVDETVSGAFVSTTRRTYCFDKRSGLQVTLSTLFNERVDYVKIISDYLINEMRSENKKNKGYWWVYPDHEFGFCAIRPDQNFYINEENKVVICFNSFEIASGDAGSPEFVLPKSLVRPYLAEDFKYLR